MRVKLREKEITTIEEPTNKTEKRKRNLALAGRQNKAIKKILQKMILDNKINWTKDESLTEIMYSLDEEEE